MDDRPAIIASCEDAEIRRWRRRPSPTLPDADLYVRHRAFDWQHDHRYTWAVCEPTTGAMLGEVSLDTLDLAHGVAEAACWALPDARGRGMTSTALSAVLRFAFDGIGLHRVTYRWASGNTGSAHVAQRCGFVEEGRMRGAWNDGGRRLDVIVAGRLATDR